MAFIIKLAMATRAVQFLAGVIILILAAIVVIAINISTKPKDDEGGKGHGNR